MADMPYTGGSKNPMCHSLYDSIVCFAYWEAMPEGQRESVEDFTQTVAFVFNGETVKKRNPEFFTANNRPLLKLAGAILRIAFAPMNRRVDSGRWNNAWRVRINPDGKREGLQMVLTGCPIADFAKKQGYMDLMPAMCNPDFVFKCFRNPFIRRQYRFAILGSGHHMKYALGVWMFIKGGRDERAYELLSGLYHGGNATKLAYFGNDNLSRLDISGFYEVRKGFRLHCVVRK